MVIQKRALSLRYTSESVGDGPISIMRPQLHTTDRIINTLCGLQWIGSSLSLATKVLKNVESLIKDIRIDVFSHPRYRLIAQIFRFSPTTVKKTREIKVQSSVSPSYFFSPTSPLHPLTSLTIDQRPNRVDPPLILSSASVG